MFDILDFSNQMLFTFAAMICYGIISYVEQIPMMPADKSLIMGLTQSFLVAIT
jgi:hypothetical protein